MPIAFCPHCNQRYTVGFDTTDYVHECNSGNLALDEEDVVVTGDWEDYSGEEDKSVQGVLRQGMANELQGTRAGIEGEKKEAVTRRGARASTHRQRQHFEWIDIKKDKLKGG